MTLHLDGVTVRLGAQDRLRKVDLQVAAGEIVALVGPNGAGKSTLLRAASGDLRPRLGAVTLDGRPLSAWSSAALARRRAVLPQEERLAFAFPVEEVVLLGRAPYFEVKERASDLRVVDEVIEMLGLGPLRKRSYLELSGGERQRVQLGRVFAQVWSRDAEEGRWLLLDEPSSALDLKHQRGLLALLADLRSRGVGTLLSVHDLNLAAGYADKIALMLDGRVVALGPPTDVLTADRVKEVFDVDSEVLPHPRNERAVLVSVH